MSQIRIDEQKAVKKWTPILENMGVASDKIGWMAEYAEFHSINENAYANAANVTGMGNVVAAQPNLMQPGNTIGNYANSTGTGDVGQNLLPVAMKIAAQTIGLDLVAVKPSPGPKIDLLYVDFRYDDNLDSNDERPQVFKANITVTGYTPSIVQTQGGLTGRVWVDLNGAITTEPLAGDPVTDILEYLGDSRIDGLSMFKAYRQNNPASTGAWSFNQDLNTFNPTQSMAEQLGLDLDGGDTIELVSALEDHIPGFSSNWYSKDYPMSRQHDDDTYPGIIAPKISSKTIAVGTIEVSSALRRTEIEDIKANTGMDIVQKMESILVNELSQTISKQIIAKVFEMGELNRDSAPMRGTDTIFDLNTNYAGSAVGGETTHAVQRKLITKIAHASNYIATEGRVGPAQYLVTNGGIAAALSDISGYTLNPLKSKLNGSGQLYPVGSIGDISIYVDPYMKYNDNRIALGRKNNPDQPGIIFVPYLMAQSISLISEATFAPRMLLRSRYAVAEVGWFPQKQFMTVHVTDEAGLLN